MLPAERRDGRSQPSEEAEVGGDAGRHARVGAADVEPHDEHDGQIG